MANKRAGLGFLNLKETRQPALLLLSVSGPILYMLDLAYHDFFFGVADINLPFFLGKGCCQGQRTHPANVHAQDNQALAYGV